MSMKEAINRVVEDELDCEHVSNERFALWKELDARSLGRHAKGPPLNEGAPCGAVPLQLRYDVLSYLLAVNDRVGAPLTCWFQAARLFDAAAAELGAGTSVAGVSACAAAAWLLCFKSEKSMRKCHGEVDALVTIMSQVSVHKQGVALQRDAIFAEERRLLQDYSAELAQPTAMKWLQMMQSRFDIVTKRSCARDLEGYENWAVRCCLVPWILRAPASPTNMPQRQATAAATVMYVSAGVLPMKDLHQGPHLVVLAQLCPHLALADAKPANPMIIAALQFATDTSQVELVQSLQAFLGKVQV